MKAKHEVGALVSKIKNGSLPEEEPLFTLRAQDELASAVVRFWCSLAATAGAPKDKINAALDLATAMDEWPTKQTPGRPETRRDTNH